MPDDPNDRDEAATREPGPPEPAGESTTEPSVDRIGSHRAAAEAAEEAFFASPEVQPGAPDHGDEEVDPELLKLPRTRRRRHPVISLTVIALSIYMLGYLWHDLAFYFQPSKPHDLGDAATAAHAKKLRENTYVTVHGAPDRKHALILESSFSGYESFYRLLQTSNRVFVRQHRKTRTIDREVEYEHTGRVVRFSSVPYLEKLKAYFARTMTHAHDLPVEAVRRAKLARGSGPGKAPSAEQTRLVHLRNRFGVPVAIRPDHMVWLNVEHPGEWLIQAERRTYPKEEQARERLAGIALPIATDEERSHVHHRFVVLADDAQVAALRERFKDRSLRISVVPRQVGYTARWDQLEATADGLRIRASDPTFPVRYELEPAAADRPARLKAVRDRVVDLPARAIRYITVSTKLKVPDDAVVIVTREKPQDYWFYLLLYAVLGAFIVLNGYALISRFIPRR